MATLTVHTINETHDLHVPDDYEIPQLISGEWVTFEGTNGTISVFSNNVKVVTCTTLGEQAM